MKIAYLINRYPAVSHSFIRREIEAIEAEGAEVYRFSVRRADVENLPDKLDQAEFDKTAVILSMRIHFVLFDVARIIVVHPINSLAAIRIAFAKANWKPTTLVRRVAYFAEAANLALRMRADRIDHLHAHFGTNPAMVARIASRLSGVPFSFTVHGPDEFDLPEALDLRGKIADAVFCVAISDYGRSQLMRWSSLVDWSKIEVVRCGVDASFFVDRISTPFPDVPHLCAVARLSAQKGIPLLIEAAARLNREGKSFRLTLVGDGEMRKEVEALIDRYDLHDVVEIAGWSNSETVINHLLKSRAMVLPSFAEGLPVVIMEALALGRPVVVTAIAGTPELVDKSCGWLIPAGSIDALVEAMSAAIDASDEKISQMGKLGRERVADLHNARLNGQQLYRLFQNHCQRLG
ncbi:glycosyltransferase [Allopontixanthobacter sediminis]|uniref:glycosyltransferase n=1 Tax=Allopontixanthobacter sediminis TaxID=1689985 RepID=UPI00136CE2C1